MFWKGEHGAMNPTIIYIIMGAMFLFIVVTAIRYVVSKLRSVDARRDLRRNGDVVPGRIIEHTMQKGYSSARTGIILYAYFLVFSFGYKGETYTAEKRVSKKTYRAFQDGDTIQVRCLSGHPDMAEAVDF